MKTTMLIFLLLAASVCCAELSDDVKVESLEITKTIDPELVSDEGEWVCISFKAQVVNEGSPGVLYIDLVAKSAVGVGSQVGSGLQTCNPMVALMPNNNAATPSSTVAGFMISSRS